MTKTTAEVKAGDKVLVEATVSNPEWHRATMLVDVGTTCNVKVNCSDVHSATDYATLQHRCREQATEIERLNKRIEELENPIPSMGELLGISQEK